MKLLKKMLFPERKCVNYDMIVELYRLHFKAQYKKYYCYQSETYACPFKKPSH